MFVQLREVIINDGPQHGLQNIHDGTFFGCTTLQSVHNPYLVLDICYSAFNGSDSCLLSFKYPQEINDFMSANNIGWWNFSFVYHHVHTYSFYSQAIS